MADEVSAGAAQSVSARATLLAEKTEKSDWWRTALGEYPTGVAIVTAWSAASASERREAVGMIVGSFTVVSERPPIISFMPAENSTSFPHIHQAGRFSVNVLGEAHRDLCRSFFQKDDDRFSPEFWDLTHDTGPRLRDAVAWFEADITAVHPAGDHCIVLGEVSDFGVGDGAAGLPLLFLRGGYGTFTTTGGTINPRDVGLSMRQADAFRQVIATAANELGVQCGFVTVIRDSVVVLAAAAPNEQSTPLVGMSFPFAAPLAPVLAAWAPAEHVRVWEEGARHLLGVVDRTHLGETLARVRERGFALSVGEAAGRPFDAVVSDGGARRSDYARLWNQIDQEVRASDHASLTTAYSMQLPVFDADGHARFEIYLGPLPQHLDAAGFARLSAGARSLVERLSADLGGRVPADYPAGFSLPVTAS